MNLRKRVSALAVTLVVPGVTLLAAVGAAAQTSQSTETPGETASPPAAQPTPAPQTNGPQSQPAPSAGTPQTGAEQPQPAPATGEQKGQLPPVQVVQPKPKPVKPAAFEPKPVVRRKVTPPRATPAAVPTPPTPPPAVDVESSGSVESGTTLVPMSPVSGAEIPIGKVPSAVGIVTSSDFARTSDLQSVPDLLQERVPGIITDDLQGNSFQFDVAYRGFEASPVDGVPQGIAVYQNGVRINESFGDIVNWDFLPSIAINSMMVLPNNPVYGLNALGGAITINMKDGFLYHGTEISAYGGSYGRVGGSEQTGVQSGNWAAYFGGERIEDDGWRQFSPSDIRRMYADLGFKNSDVEIHANFTAADNFYGVGAASPVQLLDKGWNLAFTTPQTTVNKMTMESLTYAVKATDILSFSGVSYLRQFSQFHQDGNPTDAQPCVGTTAPMTPDFLCFQDSVQEQALDQTGNPIRVPSNSQNGNILGENDMTSTSTQSWGTSGQAVNKTPIFGHTNQFLVGASYDHGDTLYTTASELGVFGPNFVLNGLGIIFSAPLDDVGQRNITALNSYTGVYVSDTFDVNDRLTLTGGGRWNLAVIQLEDNTGNFPGLDGTNTYARINPMLGAAYKLYSGASLYAGYSEANRAPVPAELACSNPAQPCLIESFLTNDPSLQQVVSKTWETGLKDEQTLGNNAKLQWSFGLFHTETTNDIIPEFSPEVGRGVFVNGGDTLRQGIEANLAYKTSKWFLYANYALVDARFESPLVLTSLSPFATTCPGTTPSEGDDCVFVKPGDRMPGIPENRVKLGADYWITPKWKFGGDMVAADGQVFFGDESNQDKLLPGYAEFNLHTSYDVTPKLQIFALINNLFDQHYGTNGGYTPVDDANMSSAANPSTGPNFFTNPRAFIPAAPFEVYGGAKLALW
ncbi:MAG: TonB-dependent receptor domain-containing protein [Methyloceanibacter sp.]